jgi:hypothetical protein
MVEIPLKNVAAAGGDYRRAQFFTGTAKNFD